MSKLATDFIHTSDSKAFDLDHRRIINYNIGKYHVAVERGLSKLANLENSKRKAHTIKWKVMENLDKLLPEFESNFQRKGGKVIWANDIEEAQNEILQIIKKAGAKTVIKSKSMATEEIHLNEFLEKNHIEALESDLGEYIVQLLGQKPYHIVTPAMHLSKEDIAKLFNEKFGTPIDSTPEQLTMKARELLREKYTSYDIGITGGNFLIADSGSIALTENEGNARLTTTFPKIHIAIVGIEKVIPTMNDLDLFWPILSSHGTGQNLTVYNTILGGPRQGNESDGPEEMYVILLDNGRTNLLAQKEQRQALYCIRCGACLNACPVYKNIGGHTYETTYSGPIGSIITPHMAGMKEFKHLSYASSLCGKCTEVCPVKIDIHKMLLLNRRDSVQQGLSPFSENMGWKGWKTGMLKRKTMDMFGGKFKNLMLRTFFKKSWGKHRELPKVAEKSFSKQWKEKDKLVG
ncbi:MAG: iron-sulfur cluster-binding protein [Sphingobacteriales bacterium 17-39-43]|uniref:LutB/LldF family L-lactate oxidation iron-sulfur protein n=1 Tax=Daejeonella sp. TaxID=2805397 RepID=UPI000BCEFA12|nr:LutB/LldF family L-lactate oxidation iron-sulfur protein [Daejeonella sp.]MCF8452194.1 iron-sulfur cluster-binding protein [Pedobacter sp.]OYY02739.1 MAG: iron-sulfur cluster-binding protein [Sphingobacteriia bacterium 35-40-5]OYZ31764.1 MAG: iron-sulfur cluster-binding protein [Sphingobacteriales bacterium 16-39-50]OZA24911.1 MAG: iron-sulfur cluster-binding protein [Sphingobacteriales bacterium 17-39-43]HQT22845.1 LutB/LldF family L-lactate oxidation iron-sulfur protein [Daejeonella sp.]